ncbi:MAG: hypothetical protein J7L42_02625 [Elusimicrobia bacterium]|nr:hypothetical protein [Elusimicrobiota bacterium]
MGRYKNCDENYWIENWMIIRVALPLPIWDFFDYESDFDVRLGERVLVPFGKRKIVGYCIERDVKSNFRNLKKVFEKIDAFPLLTDNLFKLACWMKEHYFVSLGMALKCILPPNLYSRRKKFECDILKKKEKTESSINFYFGSQREIFEFARRIFSKKISQGFKIIAIFPTKEEVEKSLKLFEDLNFSVFHSDVPKGKRLKVLFDFLNGNVDVVFGTRSAIFLPSYRRCVIALFDAHNFSYREEQHPQYWTEDVAIKRSEIEGGEFFGFAESSSLKEYFLVKNDHAKVLSKDEKTRFKYGIVDSGDQNFGISPYLLEKIKQALSERKKVVLFFQKGGWATSMRCFFCGNVLSCSKCGRILSVSKGQLYCFKCKKYFPVPERCPKCKRKKLKNRGLGREHICYYLRKKFPDVFINSTGLDFSHAEKEKIVRDFENGRFSIFITDRSFFEIENWQDVALFGVLDGDFFMHKNLWNCEEISFLFFSEIRNFFKDKDIEVLIQSQISSQIVKEAFENKEVFYEKQIEIRKQFNFPPFARFLKFSVKEKFAKQVYRIVKKKAFEVTDLEKDEEGRVSFLSKIEKIPEFSQNLKKHISIVEL